MDIHLPDIMEIMAIPDIMAIGTIHIRATDLTVIRIANMAAE
jgi:hypothetical protein